MEKNRQKHSPLLMIVLLALPLSGAYFLWQWFSTLPTTNASFFTLDFPANEKAKAELLYIRSRGKILPHDEKRILHATVQTARALKMPPAILWCLVFQESRLNHLLGVRGNRPSYGLGQFTHFGFHEVNYQLDRYDPVHRERLVQLLGQDVRPILPNSRNPNSPSSYFSIPTATVATGLYLKNRYLHLARILEKQGYRYDPQLLWLYASMAYNKGTRGILTFWNEQKRQHGSSKVQRLLTRKGELLALAREPRVFVAGFARIWSRSRSKRYANELSIHLKNISACSVNPNSLWEETP